MLFFADVVVAYKGLAKEKEALEASLKALSSGEKGTKKAKEKKQVDKEVKENTEIASDETETELEVVCKVLIIISIGGEGAHCNGGGPR